MNGKGTGDKSQVSRTEETVGNDYNHTKSDFVVEKDHLIDFPFTITAESMVSAALANNQVLAFPTETFYGLGGNALSKSVVERVYSIKQRSLNKPLPVLITPEWLPRLCMWRDSRINDLMDAFWPGPLTLILKANPELPHHLQNDNGSLAVRYSSSPATQRLIELGNCPIIGTSANRAGMLECSSAKDVSNQFNNQVDLIIDGGELSVSQASTIVNCRSGTFKVLRQGAISLTELNRICEIR